MWIGSMLLRVATLNAPTAGTDSLVTSDIVRNGAELLRLRLDYRTEDDLEPGAVRDYTYFALPRRNDATPQLPPGIGQSPMPYPDFGVEFSNGVNGHLRLRLRIHDDDMWIKDDVALYVREVRRIATSFDTLAWVEDASWRFLGHWSRDVAMSTDGGEGVAVWNLVLN